MANEELSQFTELAEAPALADLFGVVDVSDTTDAATGTTKRNKAQYALGWQVNPQTGTSYTYLTGDFRKLVTHSNASPIAGTLPQAGASFPAGWFTFVQNRGAGALTITPTTSTIDGAATLVLNQNEGAVIISDGTNYFTFRGKTVVGGSGGAPADATYIVQTANGSLSAEQALGALATGLLKNTTTTGVLSIAVAGTDYVVPTATLNDQTGTTYTIQASDNGKVITCSNASAITVTVPSGLGVGFNCMVIQKGAGQVTFSPSSTTVNNRQTHTKIAGQYGVVTLVAYVADVFVLGGDTAA